MTRIKDASLAAAAEAELPWLHRHIPLTRRVGAELSAAAFRSRTICLNIHLDITMVPVVDALTAAGATILVLSGHPQTTRGSMAALMAARGAHVYAWAGMSEQWNTFLNVTSLPLYGRRVLVVGYGPVGRGVAEDARLLGARVMVCDGDPGRQMQARHAGCEVVPPGEGLRRAGIVIPATGREGVIGEAESALLRDGCILAGGSMINLAAGPGDPYDAFDLASALMLAGIHLFPAEVERRVAELAAPAAGDVR